MTRCDHCPVPEGLPCRAGVFCTWAANGDPVHLRHIAAVALKDADRPLPPQVALPCPDAVPAPTPAPTPAEWLARLPLAGNLVAAMTERLGIDTLVSTIAEELGVDCGCESRRLKLNELDARFRKFLGW